MLFYTFEEIEQMTPEIKLSLGRETRALGHNIVVLPDED